MLKRKIIYTKDVMIQDRDINPITDQEYEILHKPFHNKTLNKYGNCVSCTLRYGIPLFENYGSIKEEWENDFNMITRWEKKYDSN